MNNVEEHIGSFQDKVDKNAAGDEKDIKSNDQEYLDTTDDTKQTDNEDNKLDEHHKDE